ncbi:MAG: GDP-mannose 4,6-dehydratase, partial [bacterium]|nr:GDP-mannose 4,6-dehydratase [bacterium]
RIFNTYGPRLQKDDGRVISNFLTQALAGQDLTVYGDGSQTRSFCYVTDLVRGLMNVMGREKARGRVYNLGNPHEFTIAELAELVRRLAKKKIGIAHKEVPPDDPKQRQPDITKIKEELGWEPTIELEEGLKRMFAFWEEK